MSPNKHHYAHHLLARILGPRVFSDRIALAILNILSAFLAWGYSGDSVPFPYLFSVLHLISGVAILGAMRWTVVSPYAFAITSGVFIGRAAGIWVIMVTTPSTLHFEYFVEGVQWVVLAWLIRPSTVIDIPVWVEEVQDG